MVMTADPVDMAEVFEMTREERDVPERVVTTRPVGLGPVGPYSTRLFRKFVPAPLPPEEPETAARVCWRERFENFGFSVARRPFASTEGPRWSARLLWPDGSWSSKRSENAGRLFFVSLDVGTWSHSGTLPRERSVEDLDAFLRGLDIPHLQGPPLETPAPAAADPAPPSAPTFLDRCRAEGIEFPDLPEGTKAYIATYRGMPVQLCPLQECLLVGVKVQNGRTYTSFPIAEGLAQIDAELASRVARSTPPPPPAVVDEPGPKPSPHALEPPPRLSSVSRVPAATAIGTGRMFRTLVEIPRVGGPIAAGVDLEIVAFTRPDRANFSRNGRLVLSDCPLDRLSHV